jgi:hypothetical protein
VISKRFRNSTSFRLSLDWSAAISASGVTETTVGLVGGGMTSGTGGGTVFSGVASAPGAASAAGAWGSSSFGSYRIASD